MLEDVWLVELAKAFATGVLAGGASVVAHALAPAIRALRRARAGDDERIERRLAAILIADVAGYSRLVAADEEGTHLRLRAYQREILEPKVREHRGRIVKNTGDGALAEFSSVVDAVRCALEVQGVLAARNAPIPQSSRIDFRIGINLGDVIVAPDDIYGHAVNVAARLESFAAPGGICLSHDAWCHVRGAIDAEFVDLGKRQLKNISEPTHVYAVAPVA